MKIKLLNGLEENINLKKYIIDKDGLCKSKFQKRIRDELIEKYPQDIICEEIYIKGEKFYLDFLIVSRGIVIEVNGRQHNEHIRFFHKTIVAFNKQKASDQRKRDWCKLNDLRLIEIYDE
jgi:hypothetical protein